MVGNFQKQKSSHSIVSSLSKQVNLAEIHTFFDKHEVSAADREDYLLSLLGKAAKSTCIVKAHVLIDAIMDARFQFHMLLAGHWSSPVQDISVAVASVTVT